MMAGQSAAAAPVTNPLLAMRVPKGEGPSIGCQGRYSFLDLL